MRFSVDQSGILKTMRRVFWLLPFLLASSCAHQAAQQKDIEPPSALYTHSPDRSCQPLTAEDRPRRLEAANPVNFPATRYRRGPSSRRGVEKETDCSHFVHEIYSRAGLPYSFRPTNELAKAKEFDILPEREAKAGDLM